MKRQVARLDEKLVQEAPMCPVTDAPASQVGTQPSMMEGVVVTKFRNAWRTCLHHEVTMSTLSERSQGEKEHEQRLRCGKQTKTEWWDTERLDR